MCYFTTPGALGSAGAVGAMLQTSYSSLSPHHPRESGLLRSWWEVREVRELWELQKLRELQELRDLWKLQDLQELWELRME